MEQILAALIISCSNLPATTSDFHEIKRIRRTCVQNVTLCVASYRLDKKIILDQHIELSSKCGQEVYK